MREIEREIKNIERIWRKREWKKRKRRGDKKSKRRGEKKLGYNEEKERKVQRKREHGRDTQRERQRERGKKERERMAWLLILKTVTLNFCIDLKITHFIVLDSYIHIIIDLIYFSCNQKKITGQIENLRKI